MTDGFLGPRPANGGSGAKNHSESFWTDRSGRAVSTERSPTRAFSPFSGANTKAKEAERTPRKLILCFDGTGNKFHGDESDSNILKIFRMLDRSATDQYHYYQPGIGTYVISDSLSHSGLRARMRSWYQKAKDSAVGSSFDQHVVGGYRFLMRFYQQGDEIYMFGFSRGAYIARFLAEMLDFIGLLCHGNEEMVKFAWKAFAQYQSRKPATSGDNDENNKSKGGEKEDEKTRSMYNYMKGFRETFSRPVGRIRFLGLFDTVNSVPRFEAAWMQRSKFPYTARSSAKVIRHAVSIDERRAKFRQDLMYQKAPKHEHRSHRHHHVGRKMMHKMRGSTSYNSSVEKVTPGKGHEFLSPAENGQGRRGAVSHRQDFAPYRARSKSRPRMSTGAATDDDNASCSEASQLETDFEEWKNEDQDMDEVWFAGGHGDIGGGWEVLGDRKSASHVPLAWMVREAMKAGLCFDSNNVAEVGCQDIFDSQLRPSARAKPTRAGRPAIQVSDEAGHIQEGQQYEQMSPQVEGKEFTATDFAAKDKEPKSPFHELMHRAHTSRIHDSLEYGGGLGFSAVTAWKFMEYLPFRRMDLQPNGSWKPIRWPLPCGEVRDIPDNVRVHGSVIRRMQEDENYRPGNLIIGGGGRGVRKAGPEHGIGEWVCVEQPGDPVGEIWVKKPKKETATDGNNGVEHEDEKY